MICNKKKIVYWGTGLICNSCLKYRKDIVPDFFIDSNPKGDINGKKVCKPSEIDNWDSLFVVITSTYISEISNVLKSYGLKENIDFASYKIFFDIDSSCITSINKIKKYFSENSDYKNPILILGWFFTARQPDRMQNFFCNYSKDKKVVYLTYLDFIDEKHASELLNGKVFNLADVIRWDGTEKNYPCCTDSLEGFSYDLNLAEKGFVKSIENRKVCSNNIKQPLDIIQGLYSYIKQIFNVMQPLKVIIWGEWSRTSYIFAELAKKNNIPYGFMEWGWIPGTIQFDKGGIAGQSEYAVTPALFNNRKNQYTNLGLIESIKKYVLSNQLDTGIFKVIPEDEKQLGKFDPAKKTVFLVGMGDVEMGMNPNDNYWKEYVSEVVSSTADSYSLIREICKKNDLNFIYKPHPHARSKSEDEKYRSDESTIYITDMSIDRLINMADVVVSIASAVDYKVLMYDKPLVSLGKTGFNDKDCVYEVHSRNETEKILVSALEKDMTLEQKDNYNQYLQFLLENYLWDDLTHPDFKYGLTFDKDFFD